MSITKNKQWMKTIMVAGALTAGAFMPGAMLQASAQDPTGSIHGHVQNAAGVAATTGDVKLTTDSDPTEDTKFKYDLPVDQNGNYKSNADGVAAGNYTAVYMQGDKLVDMLKHVKVNISADSTVDFDMTRQEFISKMTPEQKKELADYKAKVAGTSAENAKIANLNNALQTARADMKSTHANCTTPKPDDVICPPSASNYDDAATVLQQAVALKPDQGILWFTLGDAQSGQKKYDDAATSYNKAIALNDAVAALHNPKNKANPELDAAAYNNLGQALANEGHTPDAVAAFDAAVKAQPAQAGMYYFNESAVFFNHGDSASALAAADKAIAADPTQADPYFIRGQSLIGNSTVDPKSGKIIAPPGCAEAYQKYLELAPNGVHAQDATDILNSLGQTIHSTYKAGKKN